MRKVIAAEFVTLDGFVAGTNGEMDWGPTVIDPNDLEPEWDTILLGRVTYQLWLDFWPNTPLGQNPHADFINKSTKIVFSRTLEAAPWGSWNNVRLVPELTPAVIYELKEQRGGNMAILGSANLVRSFAGLGLIDEYLLKVFPVVLGAGKPLFAGVGQRHDLELVEASPSKSGVVTLRYRSVARAT